MRDHFILRLSELAAQDPRVILVTGDLGFGVFDHYRKEYPQQFINAGVSEQNMTLLATGMAMEGRIVFTYSIGNFPTLRCLEMIRNDAAYHDANVKVVSIGGGFSYGALGISHHATEDLAIMRSLPGLTVVAPGGLWETMEATTTLARTPGTCFLRLDKDNGDDAPGPHEQFQLGRARILQEGEDCTIIVAGGILREVQLAAKSLGMRGIKVRILNMHTIKPLDGEAVLSAARETGGIITVEEHTLHGGLGSAVAEVLADNGVRPNRFLRIGLEAGFSSIVGSQDYLRKAYGLDAGAIVTRIEKLLRK